MVESVAAVALLIAKIVVYTPDRVRVRQTSDAAVHQERTRLMQVMIHGRPVAVLADKSRRNWMIIRRHYSLRWVSLASQSQAWLVILKSEFP